MADIPDFTGVPLPAKGKEAFPDWVAPSTEERMCGEYAAVRNAIEQGLRFELKQGKTGDEILNQWCAARGVDRKKLVLAAVRFNLATEAEYAALVAGEPAVKVGEHGVTEGLPPEEQRPVPVIPGEVAVAPQEQRPMPVIRGEVAIAPMEHIRKDAEARREKQAMEAAREELDAFTEPAEEQPPKSSRARGRE